jgi:predicted nucleic acid-binding protein
MTATNKVSFDTNILIYSVDLRNLEKHNLCRKIVKRCAQMGGVVSLQCLSEFYRATTRKNIFPPSIAFNVVAATRAAMKVVAPSEEDLLKAMQYHQTYHQQFFDALIRAPWNVQGAPYSCLKTLAMAARLVFSPSSTPSN